MCGRFTLTVEDRSWLAAQLGVPVEQIPADGYRPRYNIAPTDQHWIVRTKYEEPELLPARWGLVQYGSKDAHRAASQINARAETADRRPAYRNAFRSRRCVVPADGFFEWVGPKTDRRPTWFHHPGGELLLFAGLYESWQPTPDTWERTFTILTTEPNATVAPVHDRMPVILSEDLADDWMHSRETDLARLRAMLAPCPAELLVSTPVAKRVNSVRNDDAGCLEPLEAGSQSTGS